jgi:hypothetical protein
MDDVVGVVATVALATGLLGWCCYWFFFSEVVLMLGGLGATRVVTDLGFLLGGWIQGLLSLLVTGRDGMGWV